MITLVLLIWMTLYFLSTMSPCLATKTSPSSNKKDFLGLGGLAGKAIKLERNRRRRRSGRWRGRHLRAHGTSYVGNSFVDRLLFHPENVSSAGFILFALAGCQDVQAQLWVQSAVVGCFCKRRIFSAGCPRWCLQATASWRNWCRSRRSYRCPPEGRSPAARSSSAPAFYFPSLYSLLSFFSSGDRRCIAR